MLCWIQFMIELKTRGYVDIFVIGFPLEFDWIYWNDQGRVSKIYSNRNTIFEVILRSSLFLFPFGWTQRSLFSVTFQLGSVQSAGLWPSHHERCSASRGSFSTTGCFGLFAQTVLYGLTAAPSIQQVCQPTYITADYLSLSLQDEPPTTAHSYS